MEGSGEAILISWCKNAIGSEQVAALEDKVQGYINIHNSQPVYHNEAPSKFSALPKGYIKCVCPQTVDILDIIVI